MISKTRLEIYSNSGPKTRAYILGEKQALRKLGEALRKAADGVLGCETLIIYGSDGHDYEIFITRDVTEEEWQNLNQPKDIRSIQIFDEIKDELTKNKEIS